jgi:hypothetical protein
MRRLPVLLLLAACTPDGGLKVYNNPPEVTFTAPADGTTVAAGAWVTFEAQIKDYQDELADLELVWRSSDGSTPEGTLSYVEGGVVYVVEGFPAGDPTITLQAIDTMGDAGEDTVTLHIVPNEPPSATFTAPLEAAVVLAEDPVRVELVVADPDEVDRTDLSLTWGGAAADVGAPTSADSAGEVTFYLSDLPPGTTQVSVTVTDSLGATANEIVSFEVVLADADGDGHRDPAWGGDDCDDADAAVYPDADEACDGVDHDCDGAVNEDDAVDAATWYADTDGDGFGDPGSWATACAQPDGYVENATDCDDARDAAHPGATETCDGTDEDCDGAVDEAGASGERTWYADVDADGFGASSSDMLACDQPAGFVADATDCDDSDSGVSPTGTELCDGEDDDCDGTVDEDDATDAATWYVDRDGDGAGGATTTQACSQPSDATAGFTDCDDGDAEVYPGAEERCDLEDDDCDGAVDEDDAVDASTWYLDLDADGYGDAVTTTSCALPSGYAAYDGDCDDSDDRYHPGAPESDCADPNDYNCDGSNGYADADADGWAACTDCDDRTAAVSPDGAEVCNRVDDDCDGAIDEDDATDVSTWYADSDADSFGDPGSADLACDQPLGYVADDQDCDDTDGGVSPVALEYCDGEDDDCDGTIDENSAVDVATWYADRDGDTYGSLASTWAACAAPPSYVANDDDCDDADSGVSPADLEYCDGEDDDCDGTIDEDAAVDAPTWYADRDGDEYGDSASGYAACAAPPSHVANDDDCDDTDSGVSPADLEYCDGEDDDCDGVIDEDAAVDAPTWYADDDGDTFGDPGSRYAACAAPPSYVANDDDCDDTDGGVSPADLEYCDGEDDDCDGAIDEDSAVDVATWYADSDGDSYGTPASTRAACSAPPSYVANDDDCDDADSGVSPADTEYCDGEDDDCDGAVDEDSAVDAGTWYADVDGDTYGDPASASAACSAPPAHVANDDDCDDTDSGVSPIDIEYCDGEDDDCDGTIDEDAAVDAVTWYADADGDTYGDVYTPTAACARPSGYVADTSDCDDTRAATNPGADEACNEEDDDCDGTVDEDDAVDAGRWYLDNDGDAFGQTAIWVSACDQPVGYTAEADDCDDGNASASPYAAEYCDGYDNNCDGTIDEGSAVDADTWYADVDGDTYGDPAATSYGCSAPSGYVADHADCDDATAAISPAGTEVCDALDTDEDCDGLADDADPSTSAASRSTFYVDADADGYGSAVTTLQCDADATHTTTNTDCDDADAGISPGEAEVCDALDTDEDCDGVADPSCGAYGGSYAADASPTASSDADAVIYGELTADYFGQSIASGIDLDNDGFEEVVIGASGNTYATTSSYYGSLFVYDDGLPTGTNDADTNDVARLYGSTTAAYAPGAYIWPLQDLDDDGYDELAFRYYADMVVWEGENIYGTQSFTNNELDVERFPNAASTLGHVRSDTGTYLGLSYTFTLTYTGQVALFYKSGSTLVQSNSIVGEDTYDYAGVAFAGGAGNDTNGDGYDDIFIGATGDDLGGTDAGAVYVVETPISATTDLATAAIKIAGSSASDALGSTVVAPGDIDGDGVPDLVTGAPGDDDGGSGSGVVFLFGDVDFDGTSPDNDATDYEAKFIGDAAGDALGTVAPVFGDVNGDGELDVVMSSPTWTNGTVANAGAAWLMYGPLAGVYDLSTTYDARFTGDSSSDACGAAVGLSDMDADGADDIVIGCTYGDVDGHTHFGTAWFFAGM